MDAKGSRARIAFALLCGLAVCCSVMYITADGESETITYAVGSGLTKNGVKNKGPNSVESVDVKKAGMIVSNTPDGRERLLKFFNKVEAQIAKEVAGRRADIAAIRAHMARNFAYNQAARATMKKTLLAKMAKNAAKAKAELDAEMRKVQAQFYKVEAENNKRNAATIARSKKTREIMLKNKHEAAENLKVAVQKQQRALAALAQATNARIDKTNKHIAANAAQIKENAKKARKDLEKAMGRFDKKMANVSEQAKKGRSKLAQQAAAQDKAFRNMANNKLKAIAMSTAAQFRAVRARMAKNRHHADMMLKQASSRMDAALSANKALQDKRFAKTVADIAAAKKEAKARVNAATTSFKLGLLKLGTTVRHQVGKLNKRVTDLGSTITHNKLEQAKVNRNVNAEMNRMMKLGNKRYNEHLKKDKELRSLMKKNKDATDRRMKRMADSFNSQIASIRKQMKKDRAHAAGALKRKTDKLYDTLKKNAIAQDKANKHQMAMTARAKLDAEDSLRAAKATFVTGLAKMHAIAVKSARKQEGKIKHLTGIVDANAMKDAKGRAQLREMQKSNKQDIQGAISACIAKGEQRALQIEKNAKNANKKLQASLNAKVTVQISRLRKSTAKSLYSLSLQTRAARAEMKKEVIFAVNAAKKEASANLKKMVQWSIARFTSLNTALSKAGKANAAARGALAAQAKAAQKQAVSNIKNAVAAQNRALLVHKIETAKAIKKTNKSITAYANQIASNAKAVAAQMKANTAALQAKLAAAKSAATAGLAAAGASSIARYASALTAVSKSLASARVASDKKFGKLYTNMAKNRANLDRALSGAVSGLNDKLAEQAALADVRFSKTVKNLGAAKAKAAADVAFARKNAGTQIVALTAAIKASESRLTGEIAVVSAEVISQRAQQTRINRRVAKEMGKIIKTANTRHSSNKRARGKLRAIMNADKAAASEETAALAKRTKIDLAILRGQQAHYRRQAAKNLSAATKKLYSKIADQSKAQAQIAAGLSSSLASSKAAAAAAITAARKSFNAKIDTMTNTVASNNKAFERGLKRITGVTHSWAKTAGAERKLMKEQVKAMNTDLDAKLARAIQIGEARAKAVEQRADANIKLAQKSLQTITSEQVESMANKAFALVQGNRQKIADNYLSLKAYAATATDAIADAVAKGKGRSLSSIGDLLQSVGALAGVKPGKDEGVGAGAPSIPLIFSAKTVKIPNPVNKINFLVDEYIGVLGQVNARWPMGLGKYLLSKVEANMQGRGILEVDRVQGKAGNFVFINGHSVGLSSKLSQFEKLAARMTTYQTMLSKLTGKLASKGGKGARKKGYVKPPEWQGN